MKRKKIILNIWILSTSCFLIVGYILVFRKYKKEDAILSYEVDLKKDSLKLYWKDDTGKIINTIKNLKNYVEQSRHKLLFASNAGMYDKDYSPHGLFICNYNILKQLDTTMDVGNFYLKPNGVFYINSDNLGFVSTTNNFVYNTDIKYATQSGPMLLINGKIHPDFKQNSSNLNIRNGVGILPNKKVLLAMSKNKINFYEFAQYFKEQGCSDALFLDGNVSKTYLPEKDWTDIDGEFGVMIGIVK